MKEERRKGRGRAKAEELVRGNAQTIRPDPGKSDRMTPTTDCNCTLAGMARSRSTSLPDCIGRFTERRKGVFRCAIPLFCGLSAPLAACPHGFAPLIMCPSPVAGNGSAGTKDVAKRTQMMAASKTGKHRFSTVIRTSRPAWGPVKKHVFTKRTQIEKTGVCCNELQTRRLFENDMARVDHA